jgi:hypothetical protein
MATLQKQYTKELNKEFGYFATWLPGINLKLGDVGFLVQNQFTKITSLEEQHIPYSAEKDHHKINLSYSSEGGVSITTKSKGVHPNPNSLLKLDDLGLTVDFSNENALIFKANGAITETIKDCLTIGEEIIRRYNENKWRKNWVVITELIRTDQTSIIISKSAKGKIELKAKFESVLPDLLQLNTDLELVSHQDIALKIISNNGLTPLFKSMKIKGFFPFKERFSSKSTKGIDFKPSPNNNRDNLQFEECDFELSD